MSENKKTFQNYESENDPINSSLIDEEDQLEEKDEREQLISSLTQDKMHETNSLGVRYFQNRKRNLFFILNI